MLSDNDKAQRWIETIADISEKVAESSKTNVVQTTLATIVSANANDYTVRLLSGPDDGSQDFNVYSKTTEVLQANDPVFLFYIGDLTNAWIGMKMDGGNAPSGGGGGSGTDNYNDLLNKPRINSVELSGNKSLSDLGIQQAINNAIENLRLEMPKIYYATKAEWDSQPTLVGQTNTMYVYTDYTSYDGQTIAGIKIGDGNAYLIDAPFIDEIYMDHISNTEIHITNAERAFWNNKVRCYMALADEEQLIFTTN